MIEVELQQLCERLHQVPEMGVQLLEKHPKTALKIINPPPLHAQIDLSPVKPTIN